MSAPSMIDPVSDDRVVAEALEAQARMLPYALGFFGMALPVLLAVAAYAPNAPWISVCLVGYAAAWAAFYGIIDACRRMASVRTNQGLRGWLHLAGAAAWALAVTGTSLFALGAGPMAEALLVLCLGAAAGVVAFSTPWAPTLFVAGPLAFLGPLTALASRASLRHTFDLALGGSALAMALGLMLNRHLRQHYALAAEREAIMQQRSEALEQSRRSARSKSDLLATLSHELRNGLSGVEHVLAAALQNPSRRLSRDPLKAAWEATQDLGAMLDATLDAESAEAGRLQVEIAPLDVRALAAHVLLLHRPAATAKGLALSLDDRCAALGGAALADGPRVRQVLNNLLGNAIKYSLRGSIQLRLSHPSSDVVRLEVADAGPGLSAEELEAAFQPFGRIARTGAGVSGAGIGLTLCQRLASLMHGHLGVESAPGMGSRFWLDLPYDVDAKLSNTPDLDIAAPALGAALRVLVVEDDALSAAMLRAVLEQLGHGVLHAREGGRALELLAMANVDLVLLDGRLPDMEGTEIARRIRASEQTQALPILGVIGGDADEAARLMAAGVTAVLRKPVTVSAVARAVAALTEVRRESFDEPSRPSLRLA